MLISSLKINGLRTIGQAAAKPSAAFNLICGDNGSGKTSFLEAIYLLGFGRSFRSSQLNSLINYKQPTMASFAELSDMENNTHVIGLEKTRQQRLRLRVDGEQAEGLHHLVRMLPVQVLSPDAFQLLVSGPEARRKFIDWGMFHVEPQFYDLWQKYTRILRQRNAALRQYPLPQLEIKAWDAELAQCGELLTAFRVKYVDKLLVKLGCLLDFMLPGIDVGLSYFQGWDNKISLQEALSQSLPADARIGYTKVGPQRSDLVCLVSDLPAGQILSRGQQKLFICAMILAQGCLIRELASKQCIYLLDDLAAELDLKHRRLVVEHIATSQSQVFVTGIERDLLLEAVSGYDHAMFHVKHGEITLV